jgi:hypothetical protein
MPIYETQKDRDRQSICAWILEFVGFEVEETPTECRHDFLLSRNGKIHAVAEYKHRKKKYPTLNIDVEKIDCLIDAAAAINVKPILIVQWHTGPLYFWECDRSCWIGEMQRGRDGDLPDRVYKIPVELFRPI